MNELQRIAQILGINTGEDNSRLCLLIQDKIKLKDREVNKKNFCNEMLKAQVKKYEVEVKKLHNMNAESIEVSEYVRLKQSYDNLKKNYKKTLEDNHKLRNSIELYREHELKDKIKKIVG
jgi:hypothetical protein